MDNINAMWAAQLAGMNINTGTTNTQNNSSVQFDDVLNGIYSEDNTATAAAQLQQQVLENISQRVDGAPNYLYSLHPKVYEKMQDDPEFMIDMLSVVDDWTSSNAFNQARSTSAISSLLVGEDGEYSMSSALMDTVGTGSESILDFVVSSGSLQAQGNFRKFLEQFDDLPEDLKNVLMSNIDSSQVASSGQDYNASYYEAMSAMTEAQKRLMDISTE